MTGSHKNLRYSHVPPLKGLLCPLVNFECRQDMLVEVRVVESYIARIPLQLAVEDEASLIQCVRMYTLYRRVTYQHGNICNMTRVNLPESVGHGNRRAPGPFVIQLLLAQCGRRTGEQALGALNRQLEVYLCGHRDVP